MDQPHYHFAGVAGVGMSALAQAALQQAYLVTGSDRSRDQGLDLPVLRTLALAGVKLVPQDGAAIDARTRGLVVSSAIEPANPELAAAARLGVPVRHRAEFLASLVQGKRLIAVTGTSGKSTVTAMIGWLLQELGADPVVVNGAAVIGWEGEASVGNFRAGASDLWVIEADESDRSVLQFRPDWAVVTNASLDHFSLGETEALFEQFTRQVRVGWVGWRNMPVFLDQCDPYFMAGASRFVYGGTAFRVGLPGAHNAANALQAVLLCERLGYNREALSGALATFRGIRRRLERVGSARGVTVVDDYAHNPAKIRAALQTLRPHYARMVMIWRPHGYGPLRSMMDDLVETFAELCRGVDVLYLLPVYDAGGTADRSVQSDALADRLAARGVRAVYVEDAALLVDAIPPLTGERDVVLVMGARDPGLPGLARRLIEAIGA